MIAAIRYASEKDLPRIVEINNQAISTRCSTGYLAKVSAEDRKGWFAEHKVEKYPILVAELDELIVGWAGIEPYRKGRKAFEKTVEISLFVHQEHTRKGVGNQLLIAMMQIAKEIGYTTLIAIILDKNLASRKLFEKNNFEQWAFLPNVADIDRKIYSHVYYGRKL